MFCPSCGVEYRPGFTRCNDCDVNLVDELTAENSEAASETIAADPMESPVLLWRGTNGGLFSEITVALEEAGIRYNREELDARLIYANQSTPLEIWVREEDLPIARKLQEEVLAAAQAGATNSTPADAEYDAEDDDRELPAASTVVEELLPEDAVEEVWSGQDEEKALFLKSCLIANGVACLVESRDAGGFAVRVRPEEGARSRGIVRQVEEGVPPR